MSSILIKKNYLNKVKLLNKYNKFYYDKSNPIVSDQEYDDLKLDIFNIEKKYSNLISKESPSLKVGFKPSKNFKKVKHKISMLIFREMPLMKKILINFEKKIFNFFKFR